MTKQAAQQPIYRGSILDADPPAQGVTIAGRITAADVWTHARENGLVVEVHEPDDSKTEEFLDNEYEVRPCDKDNEDPERNEREAEKAASDAPYLKIPAQT